MKKCLDDENLELLPKSKFVYTCIDALLYHILNLSGYFQTDQIPVWRWLPYVFRNWSELLWSVLHYLVCPHLIVLFLFLCFLQTCNHWSLQETNHQYDECTKKLTNQDSKKYSFRYRTYASQYSAKMQDPWQAQTQKILLRVLNGTMAGVIPRPGACTQGGNDEENVKYQYLQVLIQLLSMCWRLSTAKDFQFYSIPFLLSI